MKIFVDPYTFHGYQSELFPTRYPLTGHRLCLLLEPLIRRTLVVAFLLHLGGVSAVFGFIAFAMAIVVITIDGSGPRTGGLALETIAH